jgi:hypothetical protein
MTIYIVYHPDNSIDGIYFNKETAESYCTACNEVAVYGGFYIKTYKTDDNPKIA